MHSWWELTCWLCKVRLFVTAASVLGFAFHLHYLFCCGFPHHCCVNAPGDCRQGSGGSDGLQHPIWSCSKRKLDFTSPFHLNRFHSLFQLKTTISNQVNEMEVFRIGHTVLSLIYTGGSCTLIIAPWATNHWHFTFIFHFHFSKKASWCIELILSYFSCSVFLSYTNFLNTTNNPNQCYCKNSRKRSIVNLTRSASTWNNRTYTLLY